MMARGTRVAIAVMLTAMLLLPGASAQAQYNAFKDPSPSASGSKGSSEADFRPINPTIAAGRISLGATSYTVVLFKNQSASAIKVGQINLYPSSNVSVETVLNRCSDTTISSDAQCAITVAITGRLVGAFRVEVLAEHEGRSGISTASVTGDVDRAATQNEQPASDIISDLNAIDFGNNIRNEASIAVNLSNVGKDNVTLKAITIAGAGSGLMLGRRGCQDDLVLKPGEACPLTISWVPARPGAILDSLQITHTGARGILTVPIRGSGDSSVRGTGIFDDTAAARSYGGTAVAATSAPVSTAAAVSTPTLSGFTITSHATTRAVLSGAGGAVIVRDGEEVVLNGIKWRVSVVPSGVVLASKESGEARLSFDSGLRPLRNDNNDAPSASSPSTATSSAPASAATPSSGAAPRSAPPALMQDLQRIIP